jgi:hypothetical protein
MDLGMPEIRHGGDDMGSNHLCSMVAARRALAPALGLALHACGMAPSPSSLPSTAVASSALTDSPGNNGLPARSLLHNAITTNPKALRVLLDNPLNDALFDARKHPYMSLQLTDSNARDVMEYVVSCALDGSKQLRYVEHDSHAVHVWTGKMGLCPGWSTQKPSVECVQLVSSCLFARTNRLHSWVPALFSSPHLSSPRDRVEIATKYPKDEDHPAVGLSRGKDIQAFSDGWKPGYVGHCTPGAPITLSIPGPSRCAQASLRVCKGIRGCESESRDRLEEKHGPCNDAPLTFTCPAEGFYGVMTKPTKAAVVQRASDAGTYPALEKDVFPFLEGAFFGNLFDPDGLTRFREIVRDHGKSKRTGGRLSNSKEDGDDNDDDDNEDKPDSVPYRNIYACYSHDNDEEGVAYLTARVCAKPGSKKCFPQPLRRCHFKDTDMNGKGGYHCRWRSSDGLYRGCQGNDGVRYPSMTVYLNAPCGLTESGCSAGLPKAPAD